MNGRILKKRIASLFRFAGVEAILVVNTGAEDPNFIYMTDLAGGLFEGNLLLVTRKGVTLFTSPLEYELAKAQLKDSIRIVNLDSKGALAVLVNGLKGRTVGINGNFVPYNTYMRIRRKMKIRRLVDVSGAFERARIVKDGEELRRMIAANRITKRAIAETQKRLKEGMTERQAAAGFEALALKYGADAVSFPPIVCFGKNAALPHHGPDGTKLKHGDLVLIDVGVKVRNYCSDVTRTTIFGSGRARIMDYERKRRIIGVVKEAQRLAMQTIMEGIKGVRPHEAAQEYIDSADKGAYKGAFIHSLGHSIGIEVHDGSESMLAPGSKLVLKAGMVSSVEPGIYLPGFGGARLEDDIVVTRKGCRIL